MRRTRWLLLAAIAALIGAVGGSYYIQRRIQLSNAPQIPAALPLGVNATANDWHWAHSEGDRPIVDVRAKDFRQIQEPSKFELKGVELRLYHKDGKQFDLVKSAHAEFDLAARQLYSDGEVEIAMGLKGEEAAGNRLVHHPHIGRQLRQRDGTGQHRARRILRVRERQRQRDGRRLRSVASRTVDARERQAGLAADRSPAPSPCTSRRAS